MESSLFAVEISPRVETLKFYSADYPDATARFSDFGLISNNSLVFWSVSFFPSFPLLVYVLAQALMGATQLCANLWGGEYG